jgi:hypothetical protein
MFAPASTNTPSSMPPLSRSIATAQAQQGDSNQTAADAASFFAGVTRRDPKKWGRAGLSAQARHVDRNVRPTSWATSGNTRSRPVPAIKGSAGVS